MCGKVFEWGARTYIMGILNITPDSFSDGGRFMDADRAAERAGDMIRMGADIIDVGGESTRPGCSGIAAEEELARVLPVLERLEPGIPVSIDTYKARVAEAAARAGACMINDVSGLRACPDIASVAAEYGAYLVIVHNSPEPAENGVMTSLIAFLETAVNTALAAGVSAERIILDPGIGFGRKACADNLEIMRGLAGLKSMGFPIMLGVSRKAFIGEILNAPPSERLFGTAAANVLGIAAGADIIRVHDVAENLRAAKVADAIVRRPGSRRTP